MARIALDKPAYYLNRELSWLAFNRRVLEEASDDRNPVLERVKFLAISASNLDEFFEIRVAGILQQEDDAELGPDGLSPSELLPRLAEEAHALTAEQYRCWNQELKPALANNGILVRTVEELDRAGREFLDDFCERELDPLLTPITVDPAHPFPRVINKALCQALLLQKRRRSAEYLGVITVPRALPRVLRVPASGDAIEYVFLADLVGSHAARLYRGYDILSEAAFRITRNSNLYLQEEESRGLLENVRTQLQHRHRGDAVRLEIEADAGPAIVEQLRSNFALGEWQVFRTEGPVSLSRVLHIYELTDRPDLKFKPFTPREVSLPAGTPNIFAELKHRDVLMHHPFDSYAPVVRFLETAVDDPSVLSIRQTLYRTNEDSPFIQALLRAAGKKEVSVVVELKARFDEASNIRWARSLEDAGVQVFHGLVGLKTHCKLTLLVRREEDGSTRRYLHLGTGNYNPSTARFYTDLSLLTADVEMTGAAHEVFNYLTAYAEQPDYEPLLVAPSNLAEQMASLIAREAAHAQAGRPARIIAKVNGLLDKALIEELYRASLAGVEIDLIVRGMCALRPGLRQVSSRIRVRSLVGRFLEHSRIFHFENGGHPEVFLGSADWMPRNLYERVELVFPVRDPALRDRLRFEILDAYLADNLKARTLRSDGTYTRPPRGPRGGFSAQDFFIQLAEGKAGPDSIPRPAAARVRTRRATPKAR